MLNCAAASPDMTASLANSLVHCWRPGGRRSEAPMCDHADDVHDLVGRLYSSPPREPTETRWHRSAKPGRGPPRASRQGTVEIVLGRSGGRQRALLMAASEQVPGRLRAVSRGRRHLPAAVTEAALATSGWGLRESGSITQ